MRAIAYKNLYLVAAVLAFARFNPNPGMASINLAEAIFTSIYSSVIASGIFLSNPIAPLVSVLSTARGVVRNDIYSLLGALNHAN